MNYIYYAAADVYIVENWSYTDGGNEGVTTSKTTSPFTPTKTVGTTDLVKVWHEMYEEGDCFHVYENGRHYNLLAVGGQLVETVKKVSFAFGEDKTHLLYRHLSQGEVSGILSVLGLTEWHYRQIIPEISRQLNSGKVKGFCDSTLLFKAKVWELSKKDSRRMAAYVAFMPGARAITEQAKINPFDVLTTPTGASPYGINTTA